MVPRMILCRSCPLFHGRIPWQCLVDRIVLESLHAVVGAGTVREDSGAGLNGVLHESAQSLAVRGLHRLSLDPAIALVLSN